MEEKEEKIADIVAEKRLRAAEMEKTLGDQHSFVESLKDDADRIEAAWKREKSVIEADALSAGGLVQAMRQKMATAEKSSAVGNAVTTREIPQPDPDWKAICEKCHDGDIEPDCEYYGEPNGCNSPIYGEHPKAQPVGNAAAMREALKEARKVIKAMGGYWARITLPIIDAALAAPARNCDRQIASAWDVLKIWDKGLDTASDMVALIEWLIAPAEKEGKGDDPASYEFRIDKSDPAPWHEGEIISGEEEERRKKEQEGGAK